MSVPPLVCSTPPPPDQCDDELDDDEFIYNYPDSNSISPTGQIENEFTTYNYSLDTVENNLTKSNVDSNVEQTKEIKKIQSEETSSDSHDNSNTQIPDKTSISYIKSDKKPTDVEEECNIEDLDLKLDNLQIDFQNGKETVEDSLNATFDEFGTFLSSSNDASEDPFYLPKIIDFQPFDTEVKSNLTPEENVSIKSDDVSEKVNDSENCETDDAPQLSFFENADNGLDNGSNWVVSDDATSLKIDPEDDNGVEGTSTENIDEFSMFNYFDSEKLFNSDNNVETNAQLDLFSNFNDAGFENDEDFDDFTTFETANNLDIKEDICETSNDCEIKSEEVSQSECKVEENDDFDDDFGDFDTYNPVNDSNDCKSNVDNEDKFRISESDNIDKLFVATENIFSEETGFDCDTALDDEVNYNLNKMLGESWSHLLNCEVDQSFLFPWNSSSSQKSLLRCLGIDSRNILFGPKWNTNMPRFALNLGTNPLQPIKQNIIVADNHENKPSSEIQKASTPDKEIATWNGEVQYEDFQTSSYAESLLLDLENLMATLDQMTSGQSSLFKISDLFTSACNERDDRLVSQHPFNADDLLNTAEKLPHPNVLNIGRKINLPDTHIFTPTDSETPWSHTIHYNDENVDFHNSIASTYPNPHQENHSIANDTNDDFDDFQSFHTNLSNDNALTASKQTDFESNFNNVNMNKPSVEEVDEFGDFQSAVGAQNSYDVNNQLNFKEESVLQPVKMNPIVPALNWPAPGDVNSSIFDDFSDIVVNENAFPTPLVPFSQQSFVLRDSKIENKNDEISNVTNMSTKVEINDLSKIDLFTSFDKLNESNIKVEEEEKKPNFNYDIDLKLDFKDDFDDFQCASRPPPVNNIDIELKPSFVNQFNHNILQPKIGQFSLEPTPIVYNSNEQNSKSQQILQPLSLENYSQINWPEPGINLNNLSQFNPVNFIKSYDENNKDVNSKGSVSSNDKNNEDDGWSDFVSIKPNNQFTAVKPQMNASTSNGFSSLNHEQTDDNDDWSDFVCSVVPTKNSSELKTISQNIHNQASVNTSSYSYQQNPPATRSAVPRNLTSNVNILPQLSYVSPKLNMNRNYDSHFQNL